MHLLITEKITKKYACHTALKDLSISVPGQSIYGLLGPNGAGKTSLIRIINQIIAPDSGNIRILGRTFSEKMKNRFGYLPEERGLYRKLKVSEVLSFFGELKGMKQDDIKSKGAELLLRFDLAGYMDKKVEELSKGMAQKLQFIITILHSPELLILDEPFSGLDPLNIELVKDIILEKKREGITIIFSTHLMEYAERIVDTVVMINKGKKVLDGNLQNVKATYGTRFIKISYDGDSGFVSTLDYVKNVKDYGKEMEIELDDIDLKDRLLKDIVGKISLSSFRVTEPSLNNIFMHKVNEGERQ